MISWRACVTTRPGRPIRWNRSTFIRFGSHFSPNARRFIAAFRLNARIVGAEQPGRHLSAGQIGFHRRMDLFALAAALAQPPDHLIAGKRAVGHNAKQLIEALLTERLGGKRQLPLVAQQQLPQRFADRQEAVIRPLGTKAPDSLVTNIHQALVVFEQNQTPEDNMGQIDETLEELQRFIASRNINVSATAHEDQITLLGLSSKHTLTIIYDDQDLFRLKDDLWNHPNGFQTQVTVQTPH